jgi:hypothetical protein
MAESFGRKHRLHLHRRTVKLSLTWCQFLATFTFQPFRRRRYVLRNIGVSPNVTAFETEACLWKTQFSLLLSFTENNFTSITQYYVHEDTSKENSKTIFNILFT